MKKVVLAVALLSTPLLLTGCGKKQTLNCSMEDNGSKVEANLTYADKKFSNGKLTMVMDYSKMDMVDDEMLKQLKETKMCDEMMDISEDDEDLAKSFDKCTEKWDDKKLTITITIKKSLGDSKDYGTIEDAKKVIEKEGYTCKIK